MDSLYHFPHSADVIAREAERTRHWSVEDRLNRLLELIAAGYSLPSHPHGRAERRRARERAEAEWRRAHGEVFARFGC